MQDKLLVPILGIVVSAFSLATIAQRKPIADGSSPMPICYPHVKKCMPAELPAPPVVNLVEPRLVSDGGPLPMCPPSKCNKGCSCDFH